MFAPFVVLSCYYKRCLLSEKKKKTPRDRTIVFLLIIRFISPFRTRRSIRLSEPRPVRDRLGSVRGRRSLPVDFQIVLHGSQTVRETAGRHAVDPNEIRRHGHRNIHRPVGVPASRPAQGTGAGHAGDDLADKTKLYRQIVGHRQAGEGHAGRQRHKRRVPCHQTPHQFGNRQHVRRDVRHSRAGIGPGHHRNTIVPIVILLYNNNMNSGISNKPSAPLPFAR